MAKRQPDSSRTSIGSWTGTGQIEVGAAPKASHWIDQVVIGAMLVVLDLIGFLAIGESTSPRNIDCSETACSPTPGHQVHLALLGLVLFIALTVIPVVIAVGIRRAMIGVVIVQLVMGLIMINFGAQQLSKSHANLRQLCRTVPELVRADC